MRFNRYRPNRGAASTIIGSLLILVSLSGGIRCVSEQTKPEATAAFDADVLALETRLAQQHRSRQTFLAPEDTAPLQQGELILEHLTQSPGKELPGALEHDWRGTAFVPGAKAADFVRLMQNFAAYPNLFAPQVLKARVLNHPADDYFLVLMRVRQKHVLTVVMDSTYDVTFARIDPQDGFSLSRSTKVAEIADAGAPSERALGPQQEHGFLWRLNSYWSYQERDGGLYMQIESLSLTRSIPSGLGWAIGPFVESVPRETLEFTLRSVRDALKK